MRFRTQLVAGYSGLLLVTLVTGVASVIAIRTTTWRLEHVASDLGDELTAINHLRWQAESAVAASRRYLLTGDAAAANTFADAVDKIDVAIADLTGEPLVPGLRDVEDAVRRYVDLARAAMSARSGAQDPRDIAPMFEQQVTPARDHLEHVLLDFTTRERAAFDHESAHAKSVADRMQGLVVLATGIGVFLSIALAWVWIRKLGHRYAMEREATEAARRAVAARDEMMAIVSHDLRNPLSTIAMGASLLPPGSKPATAIANAAHHMEHLIGELLDVAKLDAGKLQLDIDACSIASVFDATVSLFQARAQEANIAIAADADPQLVVAADRERVLQVLSNLVGNAFKYTQAGGRIELVARAIDRAVRVEVRDTGRGMSEADAAHVFERYWQARGRGRGSLGLGLYICKQLVEAHRGRIGVISELGEGTTFWFELPESASVMA